MEGVAKMEGYRQNMVIGINMRFRPFHMADVGLNKVTVDG